MHFVLLVALAVVPIVSAKKRSGSWCKPNPDCARIAIESVEELNNLKDILKKSTKPLEKLDVSDVLLPKNFVKMFTSILRVGSLQELYIAGCHIDDNIGVEIGTALSDSITHLAVLDIRGNALGNSGAISIAKALNNRTRDLHIESNPRIGMTGAIAFADLLDRAPNIANHFTFGGFGGNISISESLIAQAPPLSTGELFYYDELYNKYAKNCNESNGGPSCQWPQCALLKHAGLLPSLSRECAEVQARAKSARVVNVPSVSAFLSFMQTDPSGILARAVRRHRDIHPADALF